MAFVERKPDIKDDFRALKQRLQELENANLPQRMTTAERLALTPYKGLFVYDTTANEFYGFRGGGAGSWTVM